MTRPSWDEYFMILAKMAASRSTCLSRPTGAVIVHDKQIVATGYNGSLPGQPHCCDEGRCFRRSVGTDEALKYDVCRSSHAEANAIVLAAKKGLCVQGGTIYCTLEPCFTCAKMIVMAGIERVVYEYAYESPLADRDLLWKEILASAGTKVEQLRLTDEDVAYADYFLKPDTSKRRI